MHGGKLPNRSSPKLISGKVKTYSISSASDVRSEAREFLMKGEKLHRNRSENEDTQRPVSKKGNRGGLTPIRLTGKTPSNMVLEENSPFAMKLHSSITNSERSVSSSSSSSSSAMVSRNRPMVNGNDSGSISSVMSVKSHSLSRAHHQHSSSEEDPFKGMPKSGIRIRSSVSSSTASLQRELQNNSNLSGRKSVGAGRVTDKIHDHYAKGTSWENIQRATEEEISYDEKDEDQYDNEEEDEVDAIAPNDERDEEEEGHLAEELEDPNEPDLDAVDVRSDFDADVEYPIEEGGEENNERKRSLTISSDEEAEVEVARRTLKDIQLFHKPDFSPENISMGDLIGEGAYGQVFKSLHKETGKFLAVKRIKMIISMESYEKQIENLENELYILSRLHHPSIVQYLGSGRDEDSLQIYMEFMPGGSISARLKQYGSLPEGVIKNFTKQILDGLVYLHREHVVHKDLKGGNILTDLDGHVKLADFGAARHIEGLPVQTTSGSELCNSIKGSLYWMAPEMIKEEGYGRKIDIWSLGCTIIEMATAKHPWPDCKNYAQLVFNVMEKQCPPIPDHLSTECRDFIEQCCRFDKRQRPKAVELLKHPFIMNT